MKTSLEFLCISIQVAIVAAGQADEATPIASVHPKVASIYWTTDAAVDRLDRANDVLQVAVTRRFGPATARMFDRSGARNLLNYSVAQIASLRAANAI